MNWCARAGFDSTWLSVVESGVDVSERRAVAGVKRGATALCDGGADGSEVSDVVILGSGVGWMSPGATGFGMLAPTMRGSTERATAGRTNQLFWAPRLGIKLALAHGLVCGHGGMPVLEPNVLPGNSSDGTEKYVKGS